MRVLTLCVIAIMGACVCHSAVAQRLTEDACRQQQGQVVDDTVCVIKMPVFGKLLPDGSYERPFPHCEEGTSEYKTASGWDDIIKGDSGKCKIGDIVTSLANVDTVTAYSKCVEQGGSIQKFEGSDDSFCVADQGNTACSARIYEHLTETACMIGRISDPPGVSEQASAPAGFSSQIQKQLDAANNFYDRGAMEDAAKQYYTVTNSATFDPGVAPEAVAYARCMSSVLAYVTRSYGIGLTTANCAQYFQDDRVKRAFSAAKLPMPSIGPSEKDFAPPAYKKARQFIGENCAIVEPVETLIGCGEGRHWWWTRVKASHAPLCPSEFSFTDNEPDAPNGVSEGDAPTTLQTCGGPASNVKPFVDSSR